MGLNIFEKIIARTSGRREFRTGDVLWVRPDLIACHDLLVPQAWDLLDKVGLEKLEKPEKIVAVIDHCPDHYMHSSAAANNKFYREWARKNGITKFYDVGRGGFQVQILAEKGHARPGMLIATDDTEGEACGALGAFIKGSENLGAIMAIDEFWLKVPEFVKCIVSGTFPKGVSSLDLRFKLHGDFGEEFGKCVEFAGPAIDEMSIDERMNLCSSLYLSGANGIIAPDARTIGYVKGRTNEPFTVVTSDPDAVYAEVYKYDVSDLAPQVAFPPSSCNTKPISEAEGIALDQVCIGACTSGRMDDLRIVAHILKGRKVHPRVRLYINTASQEVYLQAIREGLISTFVEAGAFVHPSSCGPCAGFIAQLAPGETCLTTQTVNYRGRMGSAEANIFLAGPGACAASALEGKIRDPRKHWH